MRPYGPNCPVGHGVSRRHADTVRHRRHCCPMTQVVWRERAGNLCGPTGNVIGIEPMTTAFRARCPPSRRRTSAPTRRAWLHTAKPCGALEPRRSRRAQRGPPRRWPNSPFVVGWITVALGRPSPDERGGGSFRDGWSSPGTMTVAAAHRKARNEAQCRPNSDHAHREPAQAGRSGHAVVRPRGRRAAGFGRLRRAGPGRGLRGSCPPTRVGYRCRRRRGNGKNRVLHVREGPVDRLRGRRPTADLQGDGRVR